MWITNKEKNELYFKNEILFLFSKQCYSETFKLFLELKVLCPPGLINAQHKTWLFPENTIFQLNLLIL